MHILIAPDSFKESLSAAQVAHLGLGLDLGHQKDAGRGQHADKGQGHHHDPHDAVGQETLHPPAHPGLQVGKDKGQENQKKKRVQQVNQSDEQIPGQEIGRMGQKAVPEGQRGRFDAVEAYGFQAQRFFASNPEEIYWYPHFSAVVVLAVDERYPVPIKS